jgi:hypothetical protein
VGGFHSYDGHLDLAQTATKMTIDAIVSRLDALNTVVTDLVAQGCAGDDEEDADHRGKAHRVPCRPAGNDSFSKIKFKIPTFNGKYDPAAYLDWELEVEQKFSCHDIVATSQVKAAISEFTDFSLIWWREYKNKNPTVVPTTWEQLKTAMRHRFVPSYYARDLLNKMQRFQQGSQSVEDYCQELQKGVIRCGILEKPDAAMAHFRGGLNREIQDILDYKEYADMTQLFEFACKAECEVQGRRSRTYSNNLQVETRRPVQHLLSLCHPHLHRVRRQLRRQEPPQPQAQHPPQVVHGISHVFVAADMAT